MRGIRPKLGSQEFSLTDETEFLRIQLRLHQRTIRSVSGVIRAAVTWERLNSAM